MMTLQELKGIISQEKLIRDFLHEQSSDNAKLLQEQSKGTFEAVLTGKGNEKCLIPQVGTLHFLYRGQNEEYIPCFPSLYRNNPSEIDVFVERMRFVVFRRLLNSHPVVQHFFRRHNFIVDEEGLAQHYGLKTSVLDLTSSLDIALFFATCRYDATTDTYEFYNDGLLHQAVMYVFIPLYDNEPCPPLDGNYLNYNIRPIGLQAFPRPGVQEGYGLHLRQGESLKCYKYHFSFTCEESKYYYDKFNHGENLWVKDAFVDKVKLIARQNKFSFSVFNETFQAFRPKGFSATRLKKMLPKEIVLATKVDDLLFTDGEKKDIINEWNATTGEKMANAIFRKRWFEHEGIDEKTMQIIGKRNEHNFRTLEKISEFQLLILIAACDPLKDAEWINYMNTPIPKCRVKEENSEWKKVPASMEELFGGSYLTEQDWLI